MDGQAVGTKRRMESEDDLPSAKRQRREGDEQDVELDDMEIVPAAGDPVFAEIDLDTEVLAKVLVTTSDVGYLIGKSGKKIKEIQQKSGAMVRVSANNDVPLEPLCRAVIISGPLSAVSAAQQYISGLMQGLNARKNNDTSDVWNLKVAVPNHATGYVIGKKGETIKNVGTKSGAQVSITRDNEMRDGIEERVVTCIGNLQSLRLAAVLLLNEVQAAKSLQQTTGTESTELVWVPDRHVGLLIGKGGTTIRLINMDSGANVVIGKEVETVQGERPVKIKGTTGAINTAIRLLRETLQPAMTAEAEQQQQQQYAMAWQQPGQWGMPAPTETAVTDVISVPGKHVGIVVGKGGSTIKYLSSSTGAVVKIEKNDEADGRRKITLSGRPDAVIAARKFINEKVSQVAEGEPAVVEHQSGSKGRGTGKAPNGENVAVVVYVPEAHVGLIIGKSGSTLKQLKAESRVPVLYVRKQEESMGDLRPVDLKGPTSAVAKAQALIAGKIAEVGGQISGGLDTDVVVAAMTSMSTPMAQPQQAFQQNLAQGVYGAPNMFGGAVDPYQMQMQMNQYYAASGMPPYPYT